MWSEQKVVTSLSDGNIPTHHDGENKFFSNYHQNRILEANMGNASGNVENTRGNNITGIQEYVTPTYNPDMTIPVSNTVPTTYVKSPAVKKLEQQVDDVIVVVRDNVEKLMRRQESLSLLEEKSVKLCQSANKFEKSTKYLKRKFWWKNLKMKILMGAIVVFIVSILILYFSTRNTTTIEKEYIYITPQYINP
ncbi:unnamed protein product [Gordionus sp. m RMFG-2023]